MEHEMDTRRREILDFERSWWRHPVRKEVAVRERFGISPARYHQLLDRLIDEAEALEHDPMLVRRLKRLREARRRKRFAAARVEALVERKSTEPIAIGREA